MLLGIEPRTCHVCGKGLYRNMTLLRGGWARCSVCNEFVHYSCLASGRVGFLKQRPRVCKPCRTGEPSAAPVARPSLPDPDPAGEEPPKAAVGP